MSPTTIILAVLGVLLALSVAGNAWQYHEHDKLIAGRATAEQLNADTRAAAATCSASVDNLATASEGRQKRLEAALTVVGGKIVTLQGQAAQALQAKPDNPKDLCGSLERYLKARIGEDRAAGARP